MALAYHVAAVVITETLGAGGQLAVGALKTWLEDPAGRLPKALIGAAEDSRRVLELALQRQAGGLSGWLGGLTANAERRSLADAISGFLDAQPLLLPSLDQAAQALAELRSPHGQDLLVLDGSEVSPARLGEGLAGLAPYADPQALIAGAQTAMTRVAEGLEATCPNLAAILRAQPQDQPPLLVVVYGWCLRRRIEGDADLARGLQFERLNALHRDLGAGLGRLIPLLEQLPAALDGLADIRDGVGRLEVGNAEVKALVGEVNERLKRLGGTRGPADPRLSRSIRDGEEIAAVRVLLDRMRALSPDQRRAVPGLISGVGKLALGVGDFGAAQGLFRDLAEGGNAFEGNADRPVAGRPGAIAEAHYNAYLAALGAKDWDAALADLRQAVDLDPARFAPFSFHEYPPIRILGSGGFGAAFLCQELLDKPPVVIKALHDDRGDQGLCEGRVLAQLDHPHIVRVQRVGYAQGKRRPYLVMDYFEGSEGLDSYIKARGCLPAARVRELGLALASALAAAHAKAILHRDINPANILIRDGGDCPVKLIDFGLAAEVPRTDAAPADSPSPSPGTLVGTFDFSAPEAKGQLPGVLISARSDLYSLGATLSYCLCGVSRPGREHWAALGRDDPELADILERCLRQHPRDRWADAQALHAALAAAVERDANASARGQDSVAALERRVAQRSLLRRRLALAAAVALALGGLGLYAWRNSPAILAAPHLAQVRAALAQDDSPAAAAAFRKAAVVAPEEAAGFARDQAALYRDIAAKAQAQGETDKAELAEVQAGQWQAGPSGVLAGPYLAQARAALARGDRAAADQALKQATAVAPELAAAFARDQAALYRDIAVKAKAQGQTNKANLAEAQAERWEAGAP